MEERETMGKRIAALRKKAGMTQEQLAAKLGVTAQAVSKWENDISCPDISILSQLSNILGVTTDELLGAKPIADKAEAEKKEHSHSIDVDLSWGGKKKDGIIFGILLLAVGLVFLLEALNVITLAETMTFWGVVWPLLILGLGIVWCRESVNPVNIGVCLFGLYKFLYNIGIIPVKYALSWSTIWPIALILVGATVLVQIFCKKKRRVTWVSRGNSKPVEDYSEDGGFVKADYAFNSINRVVEADTFTGADLDISFGSCLLDLTQCKSIQSGATLNVDVSFGSLKLILPRSCKAASDCDCSFGACSISKNEEGETPVRILGDVSFGSIEVKYQ